MNEATHDAYTQRRRQAEIEAARLLRRQEIEYKTTLWPVPERYRDARLDDWQVAGREMAIAKRAIEHMAGNPRPVVDECAQAILCGRTGTGKTMLASVLVNEINARAAETGVIAGYVTAREIIDRVRGQWNGGDERVVYDALLVPDLLVIDELGERAGTDNALEIISRVVDDRYQRNLPTIAVSNHSIQRLNDLVGERVVSRLRHHAAVIEMNWDDWRTK